MGAPAHDLKIRREYFDRLASGAKTFEIRKTDRDFQVGDEISFNLVDDKGEYVDAGDCVQHWTISYILHHHNFPDGIVQGYCVLGLRRGDDVIEQVKQGQGV